MEEQQQINEQENGIQNSNINSLQTEDQESIQNINSSLNPEHTHQEIGDQNHLQEELKEEIIQQMNDFMFEENKNEVQQVAQNIYQEQFENQETDNLPEEYLAELLCNYHRELVWKQSELEKEQNELNNVESLIEKQRLKIGQAFEENKLESINEMKEELRVPLNFDQIDELKEMKQKIFEPLDTEYQNCMSQIQTIKEQEAQLRTKNKKVSSKVIRQQLMKERQLFQKEMSQAVNHQTNLISSYMETYKKKVFDPLEQSEKQIIKLNSLIQEKQNSLIKSQQLTQQNQAQITEFQNKINHTQNLYSDQKMIKSQLQDQINDHNRREFEISENIKENTKQQYEVENKQKYLDDLKMQFANQKRSAESRIQNINAEIKRQQNDLIREKMQIDSQFETQINIAEDEKQRELLYLNNKIDDINNQNDLIQVEINEKKKWLIQKTALNLNEQQANIQAYQEDEQQKNCSQF